MKNTSTTSVMGHMPLSSKILLLILFFSVLLNFGILFAHIKMVQNLDTPRIVMRGTEGLVLPMRSTTFFWKPEVASDFIKIFLPVLYNFSPEEVQAGEEWSAFINPELLKKFKDRFELNQTVIVKDELHQTLAVFQVDYNLATDSADVTAELRIINKFGDLTRTPMKLKVKFGKMTDPLNPYGHFIAAVD